MSARGVQNSTVCDADYTPFKSKIHRPSCFAMEAKKIDFGSGTVKFGGSSSAAITYNADLLTKLFLVVELNASSTSTAALYASGVSKAAFAEDIGRAMIEEVSLEIGSVVHNKFDDVFLHVYDDYTVTSDQTTTELTGRTFNGGGLQSNLSEMPFVPHKFYIPLPFWFTKDWHQALPLVAMHLSEARIRLKLRAKTALIKDISGGSNTDWSDALVINDAYLVGEYVYLNDATRHAFAKMTHWFLIKQVQSENVSVVNGKTSIKQRLSFNHMVSELLWMMRKTSNKTALEYYNFAGEEAGTTIGAPQYDAFKTASIYLNNNQRLMDMDPVYYRVVQPRMFHTCQPREFVYSYSFALAPEKSSPSGAINMSRIENVELKLDFSSALASGPYDLLVYACNFNMVSIKSGIASLAFAS
mgnify:CR=1 FL=1